MPSNNSRTEFIQTPPQATDRIVLAITRAIAHRRLMPGTKLTEQKLCDIFNVSRTIVRQALNQLARDRLVSLEPDRGAFVAVPTSEEASQVFAVRAMLETMMVRELCKQITARQIRQLRSHLVAERRALKRKDIAQRTHLLGQFHLILAQMHGNTVLYETLGDLMLRCSLIALAYQSPQSAQASHAEHVALVDALESREAPAAVRLMKGHLQHVHHNIDVDHRNLESGQTLANALAGLTD
ncbi:MAG TPA: GntR family transcriptional regulator [Orrella sp.]